MSDFAEIDILFQCFYHRMGVKDGHPVLSVRWPLKPMPQTEVNEVYNGLVFSLGSTNTVLIRDEDMNIVFDPGIIQLGRYGSFKLRLAELGLKPEDIDIVVNSHCHYDHVESNYLFKGKPLYIHEKEVEYCDQLYWPEWTKAYMGIMDLKEFTGDIKLTSNVKLVETLGHTPGSISALVETKEGLVALVGDAVIVKEDYLEMRPPTVVTKNIAAEQSVESMKRIRVLNPVTIVPGHDAPFSP
jgi:glyoxylase-like metal-dependent hydrolase (beta-lactamase superfamily II)